MKVLKLEAEGVFTSFRYPHFMQTVHPTFKMPPPATIYGHICSAIGEWISPDGILFAYNFTYQAEVTDLEHIHVLEASSGKLKGSKHPKVLEGNINPFRRGLLFNPRLTLYINKPEWKKFFLSPTYPVILGRSQDLFTYTNITVLELEQAGEAYFQNTIAPYSMITQIGKGVVELMPCFLDYNKNREPLFSRYLLLAQRVKSPDFINFQKKKNYWVDPVSPIIDSLKQGLFFHSFIGDENETITLS